MSRVLMKGNEVIGAAAIQAGCRFFFGYPITPQSELPEYMARHLPEVGGSFVQAESEVAAINMVYGAASCGVRAMTSSSSPGIALKQEGISYLAGSSSTMGSAATTSAPQLRNKSMTLSEGDSRISPLSFL